VLDVPLSAQADINKRLNQHPNVVHFIGVCADYLHQAARQAGLLSEAPGRPGAPPSGLDQALDRAGMLALVMEYLPLGTLWSLIGEARRAAQGLQSAGGSRVSRHGTLFLQRWERRLEVLCGAAAGLEYMHRQVSGCHASGAALYVHGRAVQELF
jgi:hypothetical protein